MTTLRFRSRHLHATIYNHVLAQLDTLGWLDEPANFGTTAVTVLDYPPDERSEVVRQNTVSVSLGDFGTDEDEELGALGGGLRSGLYTIYIDVYMAEQALSLAMCDDIRDMFEDLYLPLIDQITGDEVTGSQIEVEAVAGPEKPPANVGAEQFKRHWRTMRVDGRLFYPS